VAQKPPAVVDNGADVQGVQEAVDRFVSAYESRNMGRIRTEWLNIGTRSKQLDNLFQSIEIAEWHCSELQQFQKGVWLRAQQKTLTFVKQGTKWVMKDKLP
jgi:hypothetical protein